MLLTPSGIAMQSLTAGIERSDAKIVANLGMSLQNPQSLLILTLILLPKTTSCWVQSTLAQAPASCSNACAGWHCKLLC